MVHNINREELLQMIQNRDKPVVIVDVRSEGAYRKEHIQGALSLTMEELEKYPMKRPLDKDAVIVTYDNDCQNQFSAKAARKLESLGFRNVYDFQAGFDNYKQGALPTQGEERANPEIF